MIDDPERPSGRFLLRIDPGLHALLRDTADRLGLSLNEYCSRKLALPEGDVTGPAVEVVRRAAALFGDGLVGSVAFGSWARGELADSSDVDMVVVVGTEWAITRETYRTWDEWPVRWEGRAVEPHLVHLPEPGAPVSGVWAEVATEGVVVYEREFEVSRRLVEMRRQILEGRLVRRRAHGQSYWVRET